MASLVPKLIKDLRRLGLLMMTDPAFPSLVQLIVGEPVKGSWWGHEKGTLIYNTGNDLEDHPEVLQTKLLSGKLTFVHRDLWDAFFGVATAGDAWQTAKLSAAGKALLTSVKRTGAVRFDGKAGDAAKELEKTLLVHYGSEHTDSGKHVRLLRSWPRWTYEKGGYEQKAVPAKEGRAALEASVAELNKRYGAKVTLPWPRAK